MKKRNIGICIITTTLLMGGPAKATELILAKDHTNVVNQAAEIAAYKSNRPPVNKRLFKSKAVEAEIIRVKKLLTNQKLAWMFENCFPNTLETTVHYRTTDGNADKYTSLDYHKIMSPLHRIAKFHAAHSYREHGR